ncbi:PEPxxWA-CTERM sorting domain-containing protein [Sphingomonas sp. AP4-R1]|uniref:PEPxxWA-CTERM sorting domain-containing protein n=1 Tax=Sphingomonas sp. AP4-R1 TaxID=2735134 RepID=UPI0020A24029|nr:PEPxxWA-CTERM sorting domain-containing protein [Sphingomonas sp. AP4-R1]
MKKIVAALLLSVATGLAMPAAATVVGVADTSSAFPFGPNAYLGGYYYQQIYSAASFSSATTIQNLTFYSSTPNGTANSGTYRFSLSTSTAAIPTFDTSTTVPWTDPAYTQDYEGTLGSIVDGKLQINLSTAFNYDPAAGNLLLTIYNPGLSSDGTAYFDADINNGITNMRYSAYPYDSNRGLVTGFNEGASAVPEPASWAMMIGGFGLVGAAMRRRRVSVRFA